MARAEAEWRLTCIECDTSSDDRAEGWEAHLAGGVVHGIDTGELEVAIYCPDCAAEEFGAA